MTLCVNLVINLHICVWVDCVFIFTVSVHVYMYTVHIPPENWNLKTCIHSSNSLAEVVFTHHHPFTLIHSQHTPWVQSYIFLYAGSDGGYIYCGKPTECMIVRAHTRAQTYVLHTYFPIHATPHHLHVHWYTHIRSHRWLWYLYQWLGWSPIGWLCL